MRNILSKKNITKPEKLLKVLSIIKKIGFTRVVFERILPMPTLKKTPDGVLFDDQSPQDFYPTVVVPDYLIGKTLFIIDQSEFDRVIKKFEKQLKDQKHRCVTDRRTVSSSLALYNEGRKDVIKQVLEAFEQT